MAKGERAKIIRKLGQAESLVDNIQEHILYGLMQFAGDRNLVDLLKSYNNNGNLENQEYGRQLAIGFAIMGILDEVKGLIALYRKEI